MEIYDYFDDNIMILVGLVLLLSLSMVFILIGILAGWGIGKEVYHRCKFGTTVSMKYSIQLGIIMTISVIISGILAYQFVPTITDIGKNIYYLKSRTYQEQCGEIAIVNIYEADYRGEIRYYLTLTVNGKLLCPNNSFDEDSYRQISEISSDTQVFYVSIDTEPYYDDNGEYLWSFDTTILHINSFVS